jgi:hypothetical protein
MSGEMTGQPRRATSGIQSTSAAFCGKCSWCRWTVIPSARRIAGKMFTPRLRSAKNSKDYAACSKSTADLILSSSSP